MLFAWFVIFLVLFPSLHWCMYVPAHSVLFPFRTQVRELLLYTDDISQELFLEINADGSVSGSSVQSPNCVLELRSVKAGETVIKGVATSLFLCMDSEGKLRGQRGFAEKDCVFQELILEDGYTCFRSPHNGLSVSLPSKQPRQKHGPSLSRFLPIMNKQEDSQIQDVKQYFQDVNLDSGDPLGMGHQLHIQSIYSPSLHSKK
ncbi:fibroblast growth factor 21 [Triplophysa dalaica]|uniref:fibroblast growth factor 21 n=1 Tax=Triplophysa dalaica TaxID=1582913 RepID=UPI0024E02D35|nr:fibroblast growth factor 21 [Triplophysa dalaica]